MLGSKSYSGQYSRLSRGRPGFNSPFRRHFLQVSPFNSATTPSAIVYRVNRTQIYSIKEDTAYDTMQVYIVSRGHRSISIAYQKTMCCTSCNSICHALWIHIMSQHQKNHVNKPCVTDPMLTHTGKFGSITSRHPNPVRPGNTQGLEY